ncbi:MAG: trigger factor [Alphaproteobacteria bacterium]|jgi:trigger factor|nr:trigger factor [Alphaproteobacteria bacterium]
MSLSKEKIKGLKYNLSFEVSKELFEEELMKKLTAYQKHADIKGFRKGHVPLDVIRQKYEDSFISETMNEAINTELSSYLKEKNLSPATQPQIEITSFVKDKELKFTAELEVLPEIKDKDIELSKITVEKKVAKVTDQVIETSLKQLAESRTSTAKLEKDRATKKGDVAIIDFEGFIDGEAFPGGKGEKHNLELGSNSFIEGFEDQLIGKNKGDELEVNVTFPKEYHAKEFAGKPAMFKVKIHDIRAKVPVKIDDELAKQVGRKDLEDLKNSIKEMTQDHYESLSKNGMKDLVLDELAKVKITLPESLIEQEFNAMWKPFEQQIKEDKLSEENKKKGEKKLKAEQKELAEKRVKLGLLVAEIGKKAEIKVDENDAQQAIMQEAMRFPGQHEQVFKYYNENPQAMQMLRAQLFEAKILDHIVSQVKTKEKEVKPEELTGQK